MVGFYAEEPGYVDNVLGDSPGGVALDPQETGTSTVYNPGGTFDNAAFVEDDVNDTTVVGGRASLRWAPTENWTFDFGAAYQKTDADGFGDTDFAENLQTNAQTSANLGEWEQLRFGSETWEDEWYQVALTVEGSLGWGELTIAASFMNRQAGYDADSTAYISAWQDFYPNKFRAPGVLAPPYYNLYDFGGDPQAMSFEDSDQDRTSLEIRLATPADSDSRWSGVVGAFYNKSDDHTHFSANIRPLGGSYAAYYNSYAAFFYCRGGYEAGLGCVSGIYDPTAVDAGAVAFTSGTNKWWDGVYNTVLEQVAVFGEVNVEITEWFDLTLGGRWFDIDQDPLHKTQDVPHLSNLM